MSEKHTPGPWNVGKASIDRLVYADSEPAFDLAIVRDGGDNTVDANAKLIAAAPDLLAELAEYVADHGDNCGCRACAAIAKATA